MMMYERGSEVTGHEARCCNYLMGWRVVVEIGVGRTRRRRRGGQSEWGAGEASNRKE